VRRRDGERGIERNVSYASCTERGYEDLRYLLDHGQPITELVSLTPEQGEANAVFGYQSVEAITDEHGLPVYCPETYELDTEQDRKHFAESDAVLQLVNGWFRNPS
jgi:hypothetical protein